MPIFRMYLYVEDQGSILISWYQKKDMLEKTSKFALIGFVPLKKYLTKQANNNKNY